jgi:hypothetical protein
MPDGPIISAESALALLRESGFERGPDYISAKRRLAGSFVELFDPNLPVADYDGNVSYGGIITLPAAGVADYVAEGYLVVTEEVRAAVEHRDEGIKDEETAAHAEARGKVAGDRKASIGNKILKDAHEVTQAALGGDESAIPVDERAENMNPPHEAFGPAPDHRAEAGTEDDARPKLFEQQEKDAEEAKAKELEEAEAEPEDEEVSARVPVSHRDEVERPAQRRAEAAAAPAGRSRTTTKPKDEE